MLREEGLPEGAEVVLGLGAVEAQFMESPQGTAAASPTPLTAAALSQHQQLLGPSPPRAKACGAAVQRLSWPSTTASRRSGTTVTREALRCDEPPHAKRYGKELHPLAGLPAVAQQMGRVLDTVACGGGHPPPPPPSRPSPPERQTAPSQKVRKRAPAQRRAKEPLSPSAAGPVPRRARAEPRGAEAKGAAPAPSAAAPRPPPPPPRRHCTAPPATATLHVHDASAAPHAGSPTATRNRRRGARGAPPRSSSDPGAACGDAAAAPPLPPAAAKAQGRGPPGGAGHTAGQSGPLPDFEKMLLWAASQLEDKLCHSRSFSHESEGPVRKRKLLPVPCSAEGCP